MCGFIATFGTSSVFPSGLLSHRGPDQVYRKKTGNVDIEFSRLAITGGNDGEAPIVSDDGSWEVFLNGEIYNHAELARQWGVKFSPSDSMVLARGLAKLGLNALLDIRGMYAGIIFDKSAQKAFVFRDPLGEKPAFWKINEVGLSIASEATALAASSSRDFSINLEALIDFLRFGYVIEPSSIYHGVIAVPRGSVSEIDTHNQCLKEVMSLRGYSEAETSMPLKELLTLVLKEQMHLEVAGVLALSAGVDSMALLHAQHSSGSKSAGFQAITIGNRALGRRSEERPAMKATKRLRVQHVVRHIVEGTLADMAREVGHRSDQPIGDPSSISYMEIFKTAHENEAKVAFLGHGPDEFFWGYEGLNTELQGLAKAGNGNVAESFSSSNVHSFHLAELAKRQRFLTGNGIAKSPDGFRGVRALLAHSYLSANGFAQTDRLAMSFGIEPRTPLADTRVYGWAMESDSNNRLNALGKVEFKKALPLNVRLGAGRRRKQGFLSTLGSELADVPSEQIHSELALSSLKETSPILRKFVESHNQRELEFRLKLLSFWLTARSNRGMAWDGRLAEE